jgi:MoaA/NifB/PqqE/SkfB family radical SAM enzyme
VTVSAAEAGRRLHGRLTGRLTTVPILALSVHSACNCRCVMCDIWKANADKREISLADLDRHVDDIRRLGVQRVMLTGGEPLLHSNSWALCARLRDLGIPVTLVTTGLLIAQHVDAVASTIDELVVSIDGDAETHDDIRRVRGGFDRIARGLALLSNHRPRPRTLARCVVQRRNCARIAQAITAIAGTGVDGLSFLAADVSSIAFNRPQPWPADRQAEVALTRDQVVLLASAIREVEVQCREQLDAHFVVGGLLSLWRIHDYYAALNGTGDFPHVRCNAPWVSAVLEPEGRLRPCFFHPPYDVNADQGLQAAINAPAAIAFRRSLRVRSNETCRRCVCTFSLPFWARG